MRITSIAKTFLFLCWAATLGTVWASPVTWEAFAYAPAAQPVPGIGGTLTYDADTQQMLNWSIQFGLEMSPGTISQSGYCSPPGGFCDFANVSSSNGEFLYTFESAYSPSTASIAAVFALALPLTDSGGTIPLIPGSFTGTGPGSLVGAGSVLEYINPAGIVGMIVPIQSGTLTAAPEASSVCYGALGLLGVLIARTRRFTWTWGVLGANRLRHRHCSLPLTDYSNSNRQTVHERVPISSQPPAANANASS